MAGVPGTRRRRASCRWYILACVSGHTVIGVSREICMRRPRSYLGSSVELGCGIGLSGQPKLMYYNMVWMAERVVIGRKTPYPSLTRSYRCSVESYRTRPCGAAGGARAPQPSGRRLGDSVIIPDSRLDGGGTPNKESINKSVLQCFCGGWHQPPSSTHHLHYSTSIIVNTSTIQNTAHEHASLKPLFSIVQTFTTGTRIQMPCRDSQPHIHTTRVTWNGWMRK